MTTPAKVLDTGTRLAVDRTWLAHERTLMAWIRTATSLISFGFTIYKFFAFEAGKNGPVAHALVSPRQFAILMIATGLIALLFSVLDHRQSMKLLREEFGGTRRSVSGIVAAVVAIMGLAALVTALFRGMSVRTFAACVAILSLPVCGSAQELTPGAYWPLPGGINIFTAVNSFNWGDIAFDPSLPVEEASARINTTALVYTRTLSIAGRSANVGVQLPIVGGHVEGLYLGTHTEVDRFGLGDPRLSVGVNLYGAPAMVPKQFASYRMRTLVGASLVVAPPLGQYDNTKIINLGAHRWSLKPEVGMTHAMGRWVLELMAGVWLFTDNTDFAVGHTRTQDPILSTQAHLTYRFSQRVWLAADANFYKGGRTAVDGVKHLDLQKNSRVGSTFSWGLDQHQAIRASISHGAYTTIGADFTAVAVGYNYAWARR